MADSPKHPPLISLHAGSSLNKAKLEKIERIPTDALRASLMPPLKDCLKTRPDGTILDGHHRIHVLRQRGVDVDVLPRDVVVKDQD
jgi:hypothetical protein